jgi:hypothetical protein
MFLAGIEMEMISLEVIKNAVLAGIVAFFVLVASIKRELKSGTIHLPQVDHLALLRLMKLITHPARYCSRASVGFRKGLLPVFFPPRFFWGGGNNPLFREDLAETHIHN